MIHPDMLIRDIDPEGWVNLLSLADKNNLRRLAGRPPRKRKPKTRLFVIYEGNRALKAYHTGKGSVLDGFRWPGPDNLEEVAWREDADVVIAAPRNAMALGFAAYQNKVDLEGDYAGQLIQAYNTFVSRVGRDVFIYPPRKLKTVNFDLLQRGFKYIVPSNSAIILYIFDGDKLWASLIVGVGEADIDLITTHDALEAQGMRVTSWKKDRKKITSAVGRIFRKPSLGVFCQVEALAKVMLERKPLPALAKARKKEDIILDPLPWRLKAMLRAGRLFS